MFSLFDMLGLSQGLSRGVPVCIPVLGTLGEAALGWPSLGR